MAVSDLQPALPGGGDTLWTSVEDVGAVEGDIIICDEDGEGWSD